MSTCLYVYLGPYAIFPVPVLEKEFDRCKRPAACPKPTSGFCATCGLEASKRMRTCRVRAIEVHDLLAEKLHIVEHETEHSGDVSVLYLIPNYTEWARRRVTSSKYGDQGATPISPDLIREECLTFCTMFAEPLQKCKEDIGGQDLEIKWGRIEYVM